MRESKINDYNFYSSKCTKVIECYGHFVTHFVFLCPVYVLRNEVNTASPKEEDLFPGITFASDLNVSQHVNVFCV